MSEILNLIERAGISKMDLYKAVIEEAKNDPDLKLYLSGEITGMVPNSSPILCPVDALANMSKEDIKKFAASL